MNAVRTMLNWPFDWLTDCNLYILLIYLYIIFRVKAHLATQLVYNVGFSKLIINKIYKKKKQMNT